MIFALQVIFYFLAFLGWLIERNGKTAGILAIPLYFVIANLASVIAFHKFLNGETYAHWEPIRETS